MITLGTYLERSPVLKFGGARIPGPARRAAAQRVDGYNDLVARLKRSTCPAVPGHQARCPAFKIPDRRAAVWPFDLQQSRSLRRRHAYLVMGRQMRVQYAAHVRPGKSAVAGSWASHPFHLQPAPPRQASSDPAVHPPTPARTLRVNRRDLTRDHAPATTLRSGGSLDSLCRARTGGRKT